MKCVNHFLFITGIMLLMVGSGMSQTYADRLGWGPEDKVLLIHVDDVGMSHSSNLGGIEALEKGIGTSWSVMMPCPWVPEIVDYLRQHAGIDSGVHLTLTSEWKKYRWHPLSGLGVVPGLVDPEGYLWSSVEDVVVHASTAEIKQEINAQIDLAAQMQLPITHIDSHMGTLFADVSFFNVYLETGIERKIPILMSGGHNTHLKKFGSPIPISFDEVSKKVWDAGLPVLDDIHAYGKWWSAEEGSAPFIRLLDDLQPGITEIINHASRPTEDFAGITSSGPTRFGELQVLTDPVVRRKLEEKGIILTTWRELMERRQAMMN